MVRCMIIYPFIFLSLLPVSYCGNGDDDDVPTPPPPPPSPFVRCTCGQRGFATESHRHEGEDVSSEVPEDAAHGSSEPKDEGHAEPTPEEATGSPEEPVVRRKVSTATDESKQALRKNKRDRKITERHTTHVTFRTEEDTDEQVKGGDSKGSTTRRQSAPTYPEYSISKTDEPVVRRKEYESPVKGESTTALPLALPGVTLDIDNIDPAVFRLFKYHYDKIPIVFITSKGGLVRNAFQSRVPIWVVEPGEKFEYAKVFLKNERPELFLVAKSDSYGVKHLRYIKSGNGWDECKSFKGKVNRLKVNTESESNFAIKLEDDKDTTECTIFETLLFGIMTRFYSPKPGYIATEVFQGESSIWIAGDGERCISCDLYSENNVPSFLLLSIKDAKGLRSKYFENVEGVWKSITAREFDNRRRGMITHDHERKFSILGSVQSSRRGSEDILGGSTEKKKKDKGYLGGKCSGLFTRKPKKQPAERSDAACTDKTDTHK